jgi:hypothetical protein
MSTPLTPKSPSALSSLGQLRQSNVASATAVVAEADGDTWQEKIAVCESSTADGNPRLLLRSYFRNNRTGERVWDEPPSGASCINYATSEMRRISQVQMDELQLTLEMIPPDDATRGSHSSPTINDNGTQIKPKKGFLGGMFRMGKKEKKYVEPSKDLNLQRAIVKSMRDQGGISTTEHDDPRMRLDIYNFADDNDADLEFAQALSLSEFDVSGMSNQDSNLDYPKDDAEAAEVLKQVIEASQRDFDERKS